MLFSQLSLPEVAKISRRAVFGALAVGVVGLVASSLLGAALWGLGLCLGVAFGIGNFRMVQGSVVKAGRRLGGRRRPLAMSTLGRLGVISAVALGLLFVSFQLGFGIMAGLACFQLLVLVAVARSMMGTLSVGAGSMGGGLSRLESLSSLFGTEDLEVGDEDPAGEPQGQLPGDVAAEGS
ncbi:MAG: hypothetical protein ACRDVP_02155 [Acidimicrobiales bacterium]